MPHTIRPGRPRLRPRRITASRLSPAATSPLAGVCTPLGLSACTVLIVCASAGCSRDRSVTPSVSVADSAGVSIVASARTGSGEADAWRLVLDLEIGDVDGPHSFGRIADVAPRENGGVWVADAQALRVRGFDEAGREVLALGGPGQGPGEFRSVGQVSEGAGGHVSVGGRMPIELYRFDTSGDPLATAVPDPATYRDARPGSEQGRPPLGPTMGEWRFAADGSAFVQAVTLDAPAGEMIRTDVVLRPATDARSAVRFLRWESEAMRGGPGGSMRLLEPTAAWSPLADGGLWFTRGDRYELRRFDAEGQLRTIIRRPVQRLAVTEGMRSSFAASLAGGTDEPGALAVLERAVFPDSLPAISGLWASEPDGRLWVGVIDPSLPLRVDRPNAWEVLGPDGEYMGRLPIPVGLRPTRITTRYVYGVWLDDLEVSRARRYRIERME